jgi:hypothetical protein
MISNSIFEFKIRGFDSLKDALEQSIGRLIMNYNLFEKEKDKEEVISFKNILIKLQTMTSLVLKHKEIAYNISKLIGFG